MIDSTWDKRQTTRAWTHIRSNKPTDVVDTGNGMYDIHMQQIHRCSFWVVFFLSQSPNRSIMVQLYRCDSRCERTTPGPILGYPEMGYYCNVHRYQAPEEDPDGRYIPSSEFLPFLRRETSYRCKEDILAEGLKQYVRRGEISSHRHF